MSRSELSGCEDWDGGCTVDYDVFMIVCMCID
jgi:hypothetical protein